MKRLAITVFAFGLSVQLAQAKDHRWLRRLAAAGSCAAQAFDATSSFAAVNRVPGSRELNGWLADSHGQPSPLKFSLVKGGMCAVAVTLSEVKRVPDWAVYMGAGSLAVPAAVAGVHNTNYKATVTK
jgi:hypothetical protein